MDNNNEPQLNNRELGASPPSGEPKQSDLQPGMQAESNITAPEAPKSEFTPSASPSAEEGKKSVGPVFGIIIIVILIIFAGFYFWGSQLNIGSLGGNDSDEITAEQIVAEPDSILQNLESQGTSDEIGDIEADLDSTELDNLDEGLENIDLELNI